MCHMTYSGTFAFNGTRFNAFQDSCKILDMTIKHLIKIGTTNDYTFILYSPTQMIMMVWCFR